MASFENERRILSAHYFKGHQKYTHDQEWRNLAEIPSSKEICPADAVARPRDPPEDPNDWAAYQKDPIYDPNLPENIVDGPWPSKEEYVSAHYQILREDAVASLRRSVKAFKLNPSLKDNESTSIYTQVILVGYLLARSGAACRICFSTERAEKRINWKSSKRLAQGTMVALTPVGDMFQSKCQVAIVAARPFEGGLDQNPPQIDLFWGDIDQVELDPAQKYIMVEAREGYFEASRHMLVALQMLMTERFQLANHIVNIDRNIKAPRYLEENPYMDLTSLQLPDKPNPGKVETNEQSCVNFYNVDVLRNFPGQNLNSGMDESQLQACENMLTKGVSIVQGPPGTGKTFVSICALKAMIKSLEPGAPPVIVSAQTNHALDQLLNHVLEFEPNILRLGGRSDKENIEIRMRTPYELRQKNQIPGGNFGLRGCRRDWEKMIENIQTILTPLKRKGLLTSDSLVEQGILNEKQRSSLCEDGWSNGSLSDGNEFESWLRQSLMRIDKASPIDMSLPMEENEEEEQEKRLDQEEISADMPGPEDNDRETLHGTFIPFERKLTGKHLGKISNRKWRKFLSSHDDLYDCEESDRGELYRYFESQFDVTMLENFKDALRKYEKLVGDYQVTKGLCNINLVRQLGIKVIGCTTTGLSKYRAFLSALQPRTLLIEEAAETLEGYVTAGMLDSLEQLILVGDHFQLQASCNIAQLDEAPYFMKVSMFERLVNNSFEFIMLNRQRRMIPDIRKLLCIQPQPFYKNLDDHEIVKDRVINRPPIPGMGGLDNYFFNHNWPEARTPDGSCYNEDEAQMIVGFFHYLTLNGVDASKITVLTFYNGQRKLILQYLKKHPGLQSAGNFNVFTVDSYQGEENDIILLSLVRSNMHLGIGFLDNRNRVVVALSRARRGLYLFGNSVTLTGAENNSDVLGREPLWYPVIQHMAKKGHIDLDQGFPLICTRHGRKTFILEPDQWVGRAGGCDLKCQLGGLPCGHECTTLCHPFDHESLICQVPCSQTLPCGHGCSRCCGEQCFCDQCAIALLHEDDSSIMGEDSRNLRTPDLLSPGSVISGNEITQSSAGLFSPTQGSGVGQGGNKLADRTRPVMALHSGPMSSPVSQMSPTPRNGTRRGYVGTNMATRHAVKTSSPAAIPQNTFRPERRGHMRNNAVVDSSAWQKWDAKKSDEAIAAQRKKDDEAFGLLNTPPTKIVDIFRPVTVRNGERSVGKSIRTIHNDNAGSLSSQQSGEGSKSMTAVVEIKSFLDDSDQPVAMGYPAMSPSDAAPGQLEPKDTQTLIDFD